MSIAFMKAKEMANMLCLKIVYSFSLVAFCHNHGKKKWIHMAQNAIHAAINPLCFLLK